MNRRQRNKHIMYRLWNKEFMFWKTQSVFKFYIEFCRVNRDKYIFIKHKKNI